MKDACANYDIKGFNFEGEYNLFSSGCESE